MSEPTPTPTPTPAPIPDPTPAAQATPTTPVAPDKGGSNAVLVVVVVAARAAAIGYQLHVSGRPDVKALLQRANDRGRTEGLEKAIPDFLAAVEAAPDDPQANLALGRALLFLDRADEALPHLEQAAAKLDGEADSNDLLGRCLVGLSRFDEAEKLFEASRKRRPDDAMPLRDLGIVAAQKGDLPRAAEMLRSYLERKPSDMFTIQMYRDIVGVLGRPEEAIAPLTSLALLVPNDVRLRRDIQERRLAHEGHEALVAEAALTAKDPKATAVDLYLAGRLLTQDHRRLAEGKQAWERGHELDPKQPWISLVLGVTAMKERDFAKARALLEPISKDMKQLPEGAFFLAKLDQAEGKLDDARRGFEGVMQTGGSLGDDARDQVLVVLVQQGKTDEALKLVRGALPAGATGPAAEKARGLVRELEELVLRKAGRFDEALALHDEAEKRATEGSRADLLEWRGTVLLDAGRFAEAQAAFDAALKDAPADERTLPGRLLWAGVAHDRAGDVEGARALWKRAAKSGREHFPEALSTWACRRLVGVAPEQDLLGAALLGDPTDHNDAWFLEGLARLRSGDAAGAKAAWTKAQELGWPGDFPGRLVEAALKD